MDFGKYVRGLRRRWAVIAVIVLVLANAALAFSLTQAREYQGEAKVLLSPQMFGDRPVIQLDAALAVQTEVEVLQSPPVRDLVVHKLGPVPKVSGSRVGQTLLLAVKARSAVPRRAAAIANAYANAYIQYRNSLSDASTSGASTTSGSATAGSVPEGGAQLVSVASPPHSPIQPKPVRTVLAAIVLGLLLGIGFASVLEALDDVIKSKDEVRKATELPLLGVVPEVANWETASVSSAEDEPAAAEAFRSLRTSVQMARVDRPIRTIQIASAQIGDGKTTVAGNLAMVFASAGQRVVMVDADVRRPRLHELFDVSNEQGVTSVLSGAVSLDEAMVPVARDGLLLLPSGPAPPNPSEILGSRKMAELMFTLSNRFDVVVLDSPPVLAVTDALTVMTWAEAVILVVSAGRTRRKQLHETLEVLGQAKAPVVGVVLNRAGPEDGTSQYNSYYYHGDGRSRGGASDGDDATAPVSGERTD